MRKSIWDKYIAPALIIVLIVLVSYCFTVGVTVRLNKRYFKPKEFGKLSLNSNIIIQEYTSRFI